MTAMQVTPIADRLHLDSWRRRRNLTQRELAERSGVALTTINEIETGRRKPRPSTLRRLASVLGIEEWNLYNQPGESWSAIPEAMQAIKRLAQVAHDLSQAGNGMRLAAEVVHYRESMGIDVDSMVSDAEDSMLLLMPFWLTGRAWLTGQMEPTEAREDAETLTAAIPYRVREWVDQDIPQEAARALLEAEARAVGRMAAMASSDTNGSHDAGRGA